MPTPEIGTGQCKIKSVGEEIVKNTEPVITHHLLKVIVLRFSPGYLAAF